VLQLLVQATPLFGWHSQHQRKFADTGETLVEMQLSGKGMGNEDPSFSFFSSMKRAGEDDGSNKVLSHAATNGRQQIPSKRQQLRDVNRPATGERKN
jgi:hypothetical protein